MVDGKMQVFPKISKEEVKKEADKLNAERKDALDKAFYFRQKAIDQLTPAEYNQLQFNDDGSVELTTDARKKYSDAKETLPIEEAKAITDQVDTSKERAMKAWMYEDMQKRRDANPLNKLRTLTSQEIKKHFGNKEFFNAQYHLKSKDNMEITSMTDPMHQEIRAIADANSKEPRMISYSWC